MSSFPMVTQLGYVVLGVSDTQAWHDFAADVLGLEPSWHDGTLHLRLDEHRYRFVVQPTGEDDLLCAGWQLRGARSLEQLEKRLTDLSVDVERGDEELCRQRAVRDLLRFRDPAGTTIEAYWGPEMHVGRPPRFGRSHGGFRAGDLGLGHIVLAVDDPRATQEFYTDVLGFRVSDHGTGPFTFLRCNPRHHSLALGPASAVATDKRLMHFMVETNQLDDVGVALDRCADHGLALAITLGRHTNDRMVSFYAHTPSGFRFECGYDGLLVDEDTWTVQRYVDREVWGHHRVTPTLTTERPDREDQ